jgi:transposase
MEVMLLKSQGLSHRDIARLTKISENTLRAYLKEYAEGGVEALKVLRFHRPQSPLMLQRAILEPYFRTHPPLSVNDALRVIEQLTGVKRGPTQIRQFLKALGVRPLRGRSGARKPASAEEAEVFEAAGS